MDRKVAAAKAAHVAHKAHTVVHGAEWCSHCAYLGLVSIGHSDYHFAAAAMLGTTVVGAVLHVIIARFGSAP